MDLGNNYWLSRVETLGNLHKNATFRCRQSVLLNVLASCLILITLFNNIWTWDTHVNFSDRPSLVYNHHLSPNYAFFFNLQSRVDSILSRQPYSKLQLYYERNLDGALEDGPSVDIHILRQMIVSHIIQKAAYAPLPMYNPYDSSTSYPVWPGIMESATFFRFNKKTIDLLGEAAILKPDYDLLEENYQSKFFDRHEMQIPILGIRISSNDLMTIGSIAVIFLLLWGYQCNIRQVSITRDIYKSSFVLDKLEKEKTLDAPSCDHLIHILSYDLVHAFIFNTISDEYLYELNGVNESQRSKDYEERWGGAGFAKTFNRKSWLMRVMRFVSKHNLISKFIHGVPAITISLIFSTSIYYHYRHSFLYKNLKLENEFYWDISICGLCLFIASVFYYLGLKIDKVIINYQLAVVGIRRTRSNTQFKPRYKKYLKDNFNLPSNDSDSLPEDTKTPPKDPDTPPEILAV